MDIENHNKSAEAAQLFDRYTAIMALRDVETNRDTWQRLNHEAKKVWHEWLKAMEAATMRSDPDSYSSSQRMG